MKRSISYLFLAAASLCGLASAQTTAYTTPVGYVSITCTAGPIGSVNPAERNGSDTRVGLPFRQPTVAAAALTETPSSNVLTVAGASFGTDTYKNTHYVKFTGTGAASGKVFAITGNTPTTITIDLNGDTQTAVSGDTFMVSKFWTLGELFDPSVCTLDAATTGNAIVASPNNISRNTDLVLINSSGTGAGVGINLPSAATFFVYNGHWRKFGSALTTSFDSTQQLWPDEPFIIRHRNTVTQSTKYVCTGEVDMGSVVIPLISRNGGVTEKQDIPISLSRPVDVKLDDLHLGGTSAFVTSTGTVGTNAKDALVVYDNTKIQMNKSSSATYYYVNGVWTKFGVSGNAGSDVIPAGWAITIRKYGTSGGTTSMWSNTPNY